MLAILMETFSDVIDSWESIGLLAEDLGEKPWTVAKWKQRNNIPSDRWLSLINAARKRRISLDEKTLVRIAASSRSNGASAPQTD